MASASAMADALAASPRAQGVVSIRGRRGADEGWSYVVHVSGGIAATVGTEPDLRATAFVERWAQLRGDTAVWQPLERVP